MPHSLFLAKSTSRLFAITASFAVAPAFAASVEPASPAPFERAHLVTAFSPCEFDPLGTDVRASGNTIRVTLEREIATTCEANLPDQPYEIQLGAFPVGSYTVEVVRPPETTPGERVTFDVLPNAHTTQYPPVARPIADYSGLWWSPSESGWGLSLQQSVLGGVLFGALYVFDAGGQPQWYTLQGGSWSNVTTWQGSVVRNGGPAWAAPRYDAGAVTTQIVGVAGIDFRRRADRPGQAELRYTIDGVTVTKTIARVRF
ncbi:MAG TPA: hypothetical protein VM555_04685 [Tahibacter sp.]|nr:hypothetical protein [Tahibacter sp.]